MATDLTIDLAGFRDRGTTHRLTAETCFQGGQAALTLETTGHTITFVFHWSAGRQRELLAIAKAINTADEVPVGETAHA